MSMSVNASFIPSFLSFSHAVVEQSSKRAKNGANIIAVQDKKEEKRTGGEEVLA
jgi:hypothetical protein